VQVVLRDRQPFEIDGRANLLQAALHDPERRGAYVDAKPRPL